MRLLLDMNMSPLWMPVLAAHGHDVVHWSTVGDAKAPDLALMKWALSEARVVLTHDLDLTTILAVSGARGPSVVQLRSQDILPDAAEALVVGVLNDFAEPLATGALVTVDRDRRRARVLPLAR